ncbi:hypothetical protein EAH77_01135 [Ewingella americana]|uniref:Uncharacterized protein n=1 Tax=Ewingella americana TaxID=41202 RepID=A0A502GSN9_9GAMM|nr:hypothetical protein EAH77_01135 [Ewingella americana]
MQAFINNGCQITHHCANRSRAAYISHVLASQRDERPSLAPAAGKEKKEQKWRLQPIFAHLSNIVDLSGNSQITF